METFRAFFLVCSDTCVSVFGPGNHVHSVRPSLASVIYLPAEYFLRMGQAGGASMNRLKALSTAAVCVGLCSAALLQAQSSYPPTRRGTARSARPQPCWQQAGISSSTVQRYRELSANAHREVESVCSDTGLDEPAKREKIHRIRQETQQEVESLVSAQQREAFESCRAQRGESRHVGNGGGSCGNSAISRSRMAGSGLN